jgi:protein tyrosine phosphatase (PTP) superfamily phosphohydrolase (DUF442 family)
MSGHARALEDLPGDARARAAELVAAAGGPGRLRRILDDVEDSAAGLYGNLERVPLLRFLADYPVPSYTYRVSDVVARGERPPAQKLTALYQQGFRVTVNLCAEMRDGDQPAIELAGLTGELRTHHIPIVDMEAPKQDQVVSLLDLLAAPGAPLAYVHCEAGKCRTGVMIACYRLAVMGWGAGDALTEARNFGCVIPDQLAFIGQFGAGLAHGIGRYPLRPPGSAQPTPEQLAATISTVKA